MTKGEVNMEITQAQRQAVRDAIQPGLSCGLGVPQPGEMCVEAAIAFAMGEEHGDAPSCVHPVDRKWAITVNDASWPSPAERARYLLPVALASMGTAGASREKWLDAVVEGTIRRVVPLALVAVAEAVPTHAGRLRAAAERCKAEGTKEAAQKAYYAADAHSAARAAHYAVNTAHYAVNTAHYAAYAAHYAARAAHYAVNTAHYAAYCAANAADYAAYAAGDAAASSVLQVAVEVGLDAYRAEGRM